LVFCRSQIDDIGNGKKLRPTAWVGLRKRVILWHWFKVTFNRDVIWQSITTHTILKSLIFRIWSFSTESHSENFRWTIGWLFEMKVRPSG
jgi:hypothetical protein